MSVADGVYRILTALDPDYCLDLTGAVATKGANVELWARNDSLAQKVAVETSGGLTNLRFACSNQRVDVKGAAAADGTNIIQWPDTNSGAQDFVLTEDSVNTMSVNGNTYSTYEVASNLDADYVMDAAYAIADDGTNVLLWSQSTDPAPLNQRWCFVKDSYYLKTLPVPASLGLATASDRDGETELAINASTAYYAVWNCDSAKYQLRYRKRSRTIGTTMWGDWGNWTSPAGTATDEGWGDAWDENVTTTPGRGHAGTFTLANPLTASTDKDEYQFELRSWTDDTIDTYWTGAHGASSTASISVAYKPNLTVSSVEYTPYGLFIDYSSNFQRAGNKLKVSNLTIDGDLLCNGYEWDELPYSGTVFIPLSELLFVPDDQDTLKFDAELTTIDCATQFSFSKTLDYGADGDLSFTITQTVTGDHNDIGFSSAYSFRDVYIVYDHDGRKRCEQVEKVGTKWRAYPPFNVAYKVFACAEDSSDHWGIVSVAGTKVSSDAYVWNWGDHSARLAVSRDATAMMARSYTKNATAYKLNGLDYDSVAYGKADSNEISVNGYVKRYTSYASSTLADFELLLDNGYALFRDPYGGRYHVAVTKVTDGGYMGEWLQLSIVQSERS